MTGLSRQAQGLGGSPIRDLEFGEKEVRTAYIYGLEDPTTAQIRYIGKSLYPAKRLKQHMQATDFSHRTCWLQSLKKQGLFPGMVILEAVPEETWEEDERRWIAAFKGMGADLVNGSEGGMGGSKKGHVFTEEGRARIDAAVRAACTGKPLSAEHRAKLSRAHTGKTLSEEHKRKIGEKSKGRKHTSASRRKMSQVQKGHITTPEAKRKISKALGRPYPAFRNEQTGEIIPAGTNLSRLCRERGICKQGLWYVIKGCRRQHKGWVLLPTTVAIRNDTGG